jgi:hypothetical protein
VNRIREYFEFEVRFVGAGYLLLWPVLAHDNAFALLNMPIFCGEDAVVPSAPLCDVLPVLQLPPGLHLIGLVSAGYVVFTFALRLPRLLRRFRREPADVDAAQPPALPPAAAQLRREELLTLGPVRPRKTFGLRGAEP